VSDDVQAEILATLKRIEDHLRPKPVEIKQGHRVNLGTVYSAGQTIPDRVDLVIAGGGLRWRRLFDDTAAGRVPTQQWTPRDVDGPVLSTGDLLAQEGHVTEVPAPEGMS
jgi:hypothetical protein